MKRIESPSPQIEDGFARIANELLMAVTKLRLSGEEWQIAHAVWMKTYGFHKSKDTISLSQFCGMTGLPRSSVCRAIKSLVTKKLLASYKIVTSGLVEYSFNKHYNEWRPSYKIATGGYKIVNRPVTNLSPTKDIFTKDNNNPPTPQGGEVSATGEKEKPKRKKFVVPTLDEVSAYCKERNNNVDPESFIAFYESKGWKVGNQPMISWKAAVITWEKGNRFRNKPREDEEAFYPTFTDRRSFYGSDDNEEERKKAQEAFAKANNIKTDEAENAD